ncbi:MAG: hypothetical protein K2Q01_08655, partial [Rickettsiales bacterium]|nr:hypothetical protein [Rickettsiales bacterium]
LAGSGIGKGHGRTAAIITGAVLGTTVGGQFNSSNCSEQVVATTQPQYTPPVQNISYGDATEGRYCREYQNISTVAGRNQQTYGTACMQPDGSWEIVD